MSRYTDHRDRRNKKIEPQFTTECERQVIRMTDAYHSMLAPF